MIDKAVVITFLAGLIALSSCDFYDRGAADPQLVAEAYLRAGGSLRPVRLSRTAPAGRTYDFTELAVSNADVRIMRIGEEGAPEATYHFHEAHDRPGVYLPDRFDVEVQPTRTYRLEATLPGGALVSAETTVPHTFRITETSGEALVWGTDELQVTLTDSAGAGRQRYFVITTTALDPREEQLTPIARQILERADEDLTVSELSVTESPILNEERYDRSPDGTITLDIPWLVTNFYGPNEIVVRSVDDNLYDFIRSQSIQQGGSTFSPGEIPNVIERVGGGTGVFGSFAAASYRLEVLRP